MARSSSHVEGRVFHPEGWSNALDQAAKARKAFRPVNTGRFDPESDRLDELADLLAMHLQWKLV